MHVALLRVFFVGFLMHVATAGRALGEVQHQLCEVWSSCQLPAAAVDVTASQDGEGTGAKECHSLARRCPTVRANDQVCGVWRAEGHFAGNRHSAFALGNLPSHYPAPGPTRECCTRLWTLEGCPRPTPVQALHCTSMENARRCPREVSLMA